MSKRPPPATPPAVLTNTADRPCASGDGNRTRNEPDSCRCRRRVTPSTRCTSKATDPTARLAAKISEAALMVSVCICPRAATDSDRVTNIQRLKRQFYNAKHYKAKYYKAEYYKAEYYKAMARLISLGSRLPRSQVYLTAPRSITAKWSPSSQAKSRYCSTRTMAILPRLRR